MNKLLCTAALVAAALFVGSSDAHAQVVRLSNRSYRPALVRPGTVVGNVRVVSPNYNYGYGYTSPYQYSNYYGYNNYPIPSVSPYGYYNYGAYVYPNVAPTYPPYVLPGGVNLYFGNGLPY